MSILNIIQLEQNKPQNKHVLFLAITPSQLIQNTLYMKCQACLKRQKKKRNIRYGQKEEEK